MSALSTNGTTRQSQLKEIWQEKPETFAVFQSSNVPGKFWSSKTPPPY